MNLQTDNLWEIIRNVRYEDIAQLCQTDRRFLELCRTPQAQQLFRTLKSKYMNRIGTILDIFENNTWLLDILEHLPSEAKKEWSLVARSHIRTFVENNPRVDRAMLYSIVSDPGRFSNVPLAKQFKDEVNTIFLSRHPEYVNILENYLAKLGL